MAKEQVESGAQVLDIVSCDIIIRVNANDWKRSP